MSGTKANSPRDNPPVTREIRIAALGDMHCDGSASSGSMVEAFAAASSEADILVLCGDLTTHGRADQMRAFVAELRGVDIPIVAVLGNHDHEAGEVEACTAILRERGVHLLNGDSVIVEGVGFVGTKGFCGGFGRGALAPFGEPEIKQFVQVALDEAIKLENALRNLNAELRVVILHYAPIIDTLAGEPDSILPFLGSSRLLQPIETIGADVVFHGHAHHGALKGHTPGGIPVLNAAWPLLSAHRLKFALWTVNAPDRRGKDLRRAG